MGAVADKLTNYEDGYGFTEVAKKWKVSKPQLQRSTLAYLEFGNPNIRAGNKAN